MDSSRSPTDALLGEVAFVHRLARALLRDAGLAHDVAQDALTAALHAGPSRHVRGWLAAVTRHLAGRAGRAERKRAAKEALAAPPPSGDGEARTAERLRLHRRLCDAVMALPEPYRTAVTLRFFDELPPRAIARMLRVSAATVRQHVHRGLAMLRQRLDGELGSERDGWRGAFAAVGLGKTTVSVLPWLVPVVAMKKVVLGAALAAVVVVGWWTWPRSDAAPAAAQVAASPQATAAAATTSDAARAGDAKDDLVRTEGASPPARDDAFVVRVVDERDRPIAGADVHRWTTAGALAKQRTDRDGRAEFAALDGMGGLLVRADDRAPLLRELAALRGDALCKLPDGAILDGTMLVDDAPATAGLRIRVATGAVAPKSAPREIGELLASFRPVSFAVTTGGGAFSFRGLEAGKEATLVMPQTHWLLPEGGAIDDDRETHKRRSLLPARGVVLRTTQLPTVYGQVVWADDGTPVESPGLIAYANFADGDNSPSLFIGGNEDGTFAAGFYPANSSSLTRWLQHARRSPMTSVRISASASGSDGSAQVELDKGALAASRVELRLPRAPVTHFVVTDLHDRPISEARVSAVPSTVSDENGHGTFQGKRDRVLVGADGCQVQPAVSFRPAAGTANDPLRFRLAPRNHLVLNVRTASGGVPPVRYVRILSTAGDLFCGKRFHNTFDRTFGGSEGDSGATGRLQPDGSHQNYEWTCAACPDARGRIELHSLEPGVPCTVTAFDALGCKLANTAFVMPAAGETRTIDLVVTDAPRTVRGRVTSRNGSPLSKVVVQLQAEHGSNEATTGADGTFAFTGVYARGPLHLAARATGFAGLQQAIDADAPAEHALVLDPGQRVTMRIVDEEGRPVAAPARAEATPGASLHPQNVQDGEHLFVDLPPGMLTFCSEFGGARFTITQDTANPNVVLRVPRPGRIAVGALRNGSSTDNLGARATRLDGAGEPFWLRIGATDEQAELALPGRHRVELIRVTWRGQGESRERVEEVVAPAQEIEVKAGELTRVVF